MLKVFKTMLVVMTLALSFKPALAEDPEEYEGEVQPRIIRTPNPGLDIEVWTDKGEGSTYYPGEDIRVYFRASRDCYVVVYDLDTRGYVNILYPFNSADDRYVEGGRVYRIPGRYDDYNFTVDGPSGIEYIQAVASYEPLSPPNWPGYYEGSGYQPGDVHTMRMDEDEDPYVFMEWVNHRISPYPDFVTDVTNFYVRYSHPRWYYHPDLYDGYPYSYPYSLGSVYIWAPFAVEVYIDGIFFGIAPITIPSIVFGRHYVTVYYNGCRLWDDYVYVNSRRLVKVHPRFDERIRYVTEDPVKKEYRTWKEKDYRLVKERRAEQLEQKVRARSDNSTNERNLTRKDEKSPRSSDPFEQKRDEYRNPEQNRDRTRERDREFIPDNVKPNDKGARDREVVADRRTIKERGFGDRVFVPEREKTRVSESRPERTSPERSYSAPKNSASPRYEQKTEQVRQEKSSRTVERRAEVKREAGGRRK